MLDVPALIAYLLDDLPELIPGDVIVTGTTGGVGAYRTPPLWMKEGDVRRGRGLRHRRAA